MESFKQKLKNHIEHVKNVREHCTTEETTKQALILPFLDILGFNAYDPQKVKAEYAADFLVSKAVSESITRYSAVVCPSCLSKQNPVGKKSTIIARSSPAISTQLQKLRSPR